VRQLTFKGYLGRYVRSLSYGNTSNIYKLARELPVNHRLREPLLLYALSADKQDRLLKACDDIGLREQYSGIVNTYSWCDMVQALEARDERLERDYHKIYRSFVSQLNMPATDRRVKALMHGKIKDIQTSKQVSNYRIYTDLKLDCSNVNSFLKHCDVDKVSLVVARTMLAYLEDA
jgi:hypothetical protein